jgi:hypothetical protein
LCVYRVQGTIKEEFVPDAIHVEMQHQHLYITCHATRAANAIITYQIKHGIVNNDMVQGFHFI